jgi:hypothetical protein
MSSLSDNEAITNDDVSTFEEKNLMEQIKKIISLLISALL